MTNSSTCRVELFLAKNIFLWVLVALLCTVGMKAQNTLGRIAISEEPCSRQKFDVASVRVSPSSVDMAVHHASAPGGYNVTGLTLVDLIRDAYGVLPFQIDVGKIRNSSDRYDVNAKLSPLSDDASAHIDWGTVSESRTAALRCLLYERFQLKVVVIKKVLPVYVLKIGAKGSKLMPSSTPGTLRVERGLVQTEGAVIAVLISQINAELDHIVLDETGLHGYFKYSLEWSPDSTQDNTSDRPSLRTALSEELGLKLQEDKEPVDVIQVLHVEKPPPN